MLRLTTSPSSIFQISLYGSLITKIFHELDIKIPRKLSKFQLPSLEIDEQMIRKMSFRHTTESWKNKNDRLLKVDVNEIV